MIPQRRKYDNTLNVWQWLNKRTFTVLTILRREHWRCGYCAEKLS